MKTKITREKILERFNYIPDFGVLTYKKLPHQQGGVKLGSVDGSVNNGRFIISIYGKTYPISNIIWFLEKGFWPYGVTYNDKNKFNNVISNLKELKYRDCPNRKICKYLKGVSYNIKCSKFRADCSHNGVNVYIGLFKTEQEAHDAYLKVVENIKKGNKNLEISLKKFKYLKGVNKLKHTSKWKAGICIKGKRIHLGMFDTEQEAHEAYLKAVSKL